AKMGGQYVSFDDIGEISDYKLGSSSTSVGDSSGGDSSDGDSSNSGSTEEGDKEEKA
ncbi:flagellar basal body rod modification protein, partial [Campylobacter sp. BCW_8712]